MKHNKVAHSTFTVYANVYEAKVLEKITHHITSNRFTGSYVGPLVANQSTGSYVGPTVVSQTACHLGLMYSCSCQTDTDSVY